MIYYNNFKEKIMDEAALKTLMKETELNALKSQINPHFLFNSLNSISSLTMAKPEKAQEMIIKLSDFLRYSLQHKENQKTTLENELKHCLLYLEIEKVRFGKKLNFENKISPESFDKLLPSMLLQPLYENAIKYSVYESTEPTLITTESYFKDNFLVISIKNTFDPDALAKKGEGIGLKNVRTRLKLEYKRDDLMILNRKNDTYEVILNIPQRY
jgi:LytS/YehU family sensor histidine kinase